MENQVKKYKISFIVPTQPSRPETLSIHQTENMPTETIVIDYLSKLK